MQKILCVVLTICLMCDGSPITRGLEGIANPSGQVVIPRIVLTIDVSESMEYRSRISKLGVALRRWITGDIPDGVALAIVTFASDAKLSHNLVYISEESRSKLIETIPTFGQGETCIGCGLKQSIEVLGTKVPGSIIILITNIEDSESIQEVKDKLIDIKEADIKLIIIAVGNEFQSDFAEQFAGVPEVLTYTTLDDDGDYKNVTYALDCALHLFEPKNDDFSTSMATAAIITETTTVLRSIVDEVSRNATDTSVRGGTEVPDTCTNELCADGTPLWLSAIIVVSVVCIVTGILVGMHMWFRKRYSWYSVVNNRGSFQLSKLVSKTGRRNDVP